MGIEKEGKKRPVDVLTDAGRFIRRGHQNKAIILIAFIFETFAYYVILNKKTVDELQTKFCKKC